jgi:hypothetical protein
MRLSERPVDYVEQPLSLSWIPAPIPHDVERALGSWNAAVAGAILLFSSLFRSRRMGLLMYPAAAMAMVGHWFMKGDASLLQHMPNWQLAMLVGTALALIACILFREE